MSGVLIGRLGEGIAKEGEMSPGHFPQAHTVSHTEGPSVAQALGILNFMILSQDDSGTLVVDVEFLGSPHPAPLKDSFHPGDLPSQRDYPVTCAFQSFSALSGK